MKISFDFIIEISTQKIVIFLYSSLKEPCAGCAAPYGYHNVMELSTDTHRFAVSSSKKKCCKLKKTQSFMVV